ncbi:MAG: hypothetical protein K8F25_07915, partial [Fimbriimonadaceae bacterium]|nr:hypothetical protein [Alphaproteobacteria bacterium]
NINQSIYSSINRIRQHLEPAEDQSRFIVELIEIGKLDLDDPVAMETMLTGALAATPQISAVMFIDPQLQQFGVGNNPITGRQELFRGDLSDDVQVLEALKDRNPQAFWGHPVWQEKLQTAYLDRVHPIIIDNKYLGVIVSVVPINKLSDFVTEQDTRTSGHSFILYGREFVLAHANLIGGYPGQSAKNPLPDLAGFNDAVLAAIWSGEDRYNLHNIQLDQGTSGHEIEVGGENYVFVYRPVSGLGEQPFIVGSYYNRADVGDEVRRLLITMAVGLTALLLSIIAAVLVGRNIAKPIVRFSEAATKIQDLEISKVETLPGSVFRELNDQSHAFNTMLRALRWFELYVPRKVVASLIKQGDMKESISDDRDITILFTDMVGFSTISEGLSAAQVAKLINAHFELLVSCIEAEGGTVDKFIGDSVMAFWGAPEQQEAHAQRACRAARAIADAIRKDNEKRQAAGLARIGIRIGIHTGHVTVGNIGSSDRLNYTILGDAVNVAQRIEQLGKKFMEKNQDIVTLISGATASQLTDEFETEPVGQHKLKGRRGELDVFKLVI